jgi:polyisoprenoid-binding protein YceI
VLGLAFSSYLLSGRPLATRLSPLAASTADLAPLANPPGKVGQLAQGTLVLTLVPGESRASFRAREQLVGQSMPGEAIGSTAGVSGSLVLDDAGAILGEQSKIVVELESLQSDESRRDRYLHRTTLQTSQFPTARFVPRAVMGLPTPLPTQGELNFELAGDLSVHGVTRPTLWQVTARFGEQVIAGSAWTTVNITDFGMQPPKVGPVLSIEDTITLQVDFTTARSEGPVSHAPPGLTAGPER